MAILGVNSENLAQDNLVLGEHTPVFAGVTLFAGQGTLAKGTIIAQVTDSTDGNYKKYGKWDKTATNGLAEPVAVLIEDVDTTSEVKGQVIIHGSVNKAKLVQVADLDAIYIQKLADKGIYVKEVI